MELAPVQKQSVSGIPCLELVSLKECPQPNRGGLVDPERGTDTELIVVGLFSIHRLVVCSPFEKVFLIQTLCGRFSQHRIERTGIEPGDVVLVMGSGPIGIFAQQVAKASGASLVIAAELKQSRLDLAKRIGPADVYVNTEEDIVKRTMELTNGRGADAVIELAGVPITIRQAFQALKKTGRVGLVGLPEKPVEIETTSMIIYKEATVSGSTGRSMFGTWERIASLVANRRVNLTGVITDRLPLEKAEDGFQRVMEGESGKVLFAP